MNDRLRMWPSFPILISLYFYFSKVKTFPIKSAVYTTLTTQKFVPQIFSQSSKEKAREWGNAPSSGASHSMAQGGGQAGESCIHGLRWTPLHLPVCGCPSPRRLPKAPQAEQREGLNVCVLGWECKVSCQPTFQLGTGPCLWMKLGDMRPQSFT